jgi:hypothetical protein
MGFTSYSDLISEITSGGKYWDAQFYKVSANGAAGTAGRWYEFFSATGVPSAGVLSTAAGSSMALSGTGPPPTNNYGPYLGGDVSPDTKHILSASIWSPTATVVPAYAILCDFLVGTPLCTAGTTPTTITTAGLPRYTDGIGVMLFAAAQTAQGASSYSATFTCTYNDNTNAAGGALAFPGNSSPISALMQYNGTPFMPLPSGKLGVKSVNSYTSAAVTSGQFYAFLVKPLLTIPIIQQYVVVERDCVVQLPSMPRVYDGAMLAWIVSVGGAMVTSAVIASRIGLGWG